MTRTPRRRRDVLHAGLAGLALGIGACSRRPTDDERGVASDSARAHRVVSTSPSMTEIVFAIGRGRSLVGRTRFCDQPPEAKSVPEVGGFSDPNVETILALEPTLVCGERGPAGPELPAALEARGVKVYFPEIDVVDDIVKVIAEMGGMLGAADEGARESRRVRGEVDDVTKRASTLPKPRVLFLFDWKPLVAAGRTSFPDQLLALAGAINVVDSTIKYPKLGAEGLVALDPDVIIDGSGHSGETTEPERPPGWSALRAVAAGRVHRLPSTAALRPGPRIGAGLAELAQLIHRDAFGR